MQMSDCSTEQSALETATSGTFATTSSQSAATSATESQKTGVEETSMTASEVIQKFESASKSSSEANIMAVSSISSHLMQDTVSSRMKKISAEEYALAERKNTLKTVEASEEAQKNVSETLVKKTSINKKSTADKKASTEEKTLEFENSQEISKVSQCSKDQKVSISSKTSSSRHATTNSVTNINKSQKQSNARENGQKTAVVVHLHPGQSKRLSALLDNKEDAVENSRSLSTDIQYDNVSASICGLEISIRNISAQEIDVIFPGNQYCNINNPDLITDSLQAA